MVKRDALYKDKKITSPRSVSPEDHTMGADPLRQYVENKFSTAQSDELRRAAEKGTPVEVHGAYDGHSETLVEGRPLVLQTVSTRVSREGKVFNNLRPKFFRYSEGQKERLLIIVFPSPEYVDQFAEVIQLWFHFHYSDLISQGKTQGHPPPNIEIYHYPTCERQISDWSEFKSGIQSHIRSYDICVLGEVNTISNNLQQLDFPTVTEFTPFGVDSIFAFKLHINPHTQRRLLLVGAKHSYWGSACSRLAATLAELGCKHIIYAAKCGTLTREDMIHQIICPTSYALTLPDRKSKSSSYTTTVLSSSPSSTIRDMRRGLTKRVMSGLHLTVPTVIGETYTQQKSYEKIRPATIDNETGFIIEELTQYQQRTSRKIEFTALHFITDYVKEDRLADRNPIYSLVHKGGEVDTAKEKSFEEISAIINNYAYHEGALSDQAIRTRGVIDTIANWGASKAALKELAMGAPFLDSRRDGEALLDGWLAAYYHEDLEDFQQILTKLRASTNPSYPANILAAIEWCNLASDYMSTAKLNHSTDEQVSQYAALIQELKAKLKQHSDMHNIYKAIYYDLVGVLELRSFEAQPDNRRLEAATKTLKKALAYIGKSDAPQNVKAVWKCFVNKFLGISYGKQKATHQLGYTHFKESALGWQAILRDIGPQTSLLPYIVFNGELALVRTAMMDAGHGSPEDHAKWSNSIEEYLRNAEGCFSLVRNVRKRFTSLKHQSPKMINSVTTSKTRSGKSGTFK